MTANEPVDDLSVHPMQLVLLVVSAIWIGGFVLAAAFMRAVMATPLLGPLGVGWLWAMSIPFVVLAVTAVQAQVPETRP